MDNVSEDNGCRTDSCDNCDWWCDCQSDRGCCDSE